MSQTASRDLPTNNVAEHAEEISTSLASNRNVDTGAEDLTSIYAPIATELAAVETLLQSELRSDTPWVDRLLEHNWIGGGKRIRPVFLLLTGAACGKLQLGHRQLAAAVELIHAATLVHDDVLDNAETRRHLPTVNATWDNRTSVLLGDFLFTHAFYVASLAGNPDALKVLAKSSNRVCAGEIRQNAWVGNFDLSEQNYLAMIADKTGELCGCSCRLGAILAGANSDTCDRFASYGDNLGVAFQIIDDVLDLVGKPNQVGKTLGTDLVNKKPTLPIIHCLKHIGETEKSEFLKLLNSETTCIQQVLPFLLKTESVQYARSVAKDHVFNAAQFARGLPKSPYSSALLQLANFVLARMY